MALRGMAAAIGLALCVGPMALAATPPPESPAARLEARKLTRSPSVMQWRLQLDQSGRAQKGRASYYAHCFTNRKMADGARFDPNSDVAASKTLPLGTTAKVTNLRNGKSAVVTVEDRGPYVHGRVLDLAPKVAEQLDIRKEGVVPVVVAPIAVPQRDGAVKLGAGAADIDAQDVEKATRETEAAMR